MTECFAQNHAGIGRSEQLTLDFPGGKPVTLASEATISRLLHARKVDLSRLGLVHPARQRRTNVGR